MHKIEHLRVGRESQEVEGNESAFGASFAHWKKVQRFETALGHP